MDHLHAAAYAAQQKRLADPERYDRAAIARGARADARRARRARRQRGRAQLRPRPA